VTVLTVGALASGKLREFGVTLLVGAALIAVAYAFDLSIPTARHERDISVVQLVGNLKSLVGGGRDDLAGTSAWRLQWWDTIINYTFNGPHFWAGKGFGINLAIADGTSSGRDNGLIPLTRSPHNGNFTILARTGVIGLGLWLLTIAAWSIAMLRDMLRARARADKAWADFFLLVFCYAFGFLIDASFDVTLEGPMAGIWFWCVFGVGSGASMIYRAAPERRSAREFAGSMRSANMAECESRLVRRRLDMIS
jgi:O-antigen ligase